MTSTLAEQETGLFLEQYLVAHVAATNKMAWVQRPIRDSVKHVPIGGFHAKV